MRCKALKPTSDSRLQDFLGTLPGVMEGRRERQASIHPTEAHSFVASKYCKWRKGSRPRKGSRSVAWCLMVWSRPCRGGVRGRLAYILQKAHSFVASKYCKWRKGSRPRKGSRSVAWLDGMVETLVRPAKLWSLHHIPGYRIS